MRWWNERRSYAQFPDVCKLLEGLSLQIRNPLVVPELGLLKSGEPDSACLDYADGL
jgi:hypothetical protein